MSPSQAVFQTSNSDESKCSAHPMGEYIQLSAVTEKINLVLQLPLRILHFERRKEKKNQKPDMVAHVIPVWEAESGKLP